MESNAQYCIFSQNEKYYENMEKLETDNCKDLIAQTGQ